MKRILTAAVCIVLSASSCAPFAAEVGNMSVDGSSLSDIETTQPTEPPTEPPTERKIGDFPVSTASAAAFMSLDSGELLHSYNIDMPVAPASLTKLLTASTLLEYMEPDDTITVGTEIYMVQPGSSLCYLQEGEELSVKDLLKGMLLSSGNDAAYTAAVNCARAAAPDEYLSDSDAAAYFCSLMNDTAARIGMTESNFVNPEGWDDPQQYTTISDLLKLAQHAMTYQIICDTASTVEDTITFSSGDTRTWHNSNRLLHPDPENDYYCPDAIGLKTGSTIAAGYCLIAVFENKGRRYLSAVTGCEEDEDRYTATLELYGRYAE